MKFKFLYVGVLEKGVLVARLMTADTSILGTQRKKPQMMVEQKKKRGCKVNSMTTHFSH